MTKTKHFPSPVATMFARQVRPGYETEYEEWLAGISEAASRFHGSQGTTILKPTGVREEYIAISQFENSDCLEAWLCSDQRRDWLEKLNTIALDHEEVKALTGMERWFTLPNRAVSQPPARYKTAILVFVGLYPLLLVINALLAPVTDPWPRAVQILLSLSISIPVMVWVVLPWLTRLSFGWLYPSYRRAGLARSEKR
ncbi:MAG: antibiotic biosynthesis monooxygenase [Planctomycetota bacterium]